MFEFVLFLHITGAALLFVALGAEIFAGVQLRRAGSVAELRSAAHIAHATGPVHGVASLLLLGGGSYLATQRGFSFTDGWILSAFVVTLAFSIIGPAVLAKRMGALVGQLDAAPDGDADVRLTAALNDPVLWTLMHGMAASAFGIVYLMTNKPSGAVSVAVLVGTFAVGALGGRAASQRSARPAPLAGQA